MSNKIVNVYGVQAKVTSLELKYRKKFTYGLNYPFTEKNKGSSGFFSKVTGVASRISEVMQLIKTDPGSRVMLPSFGAGLSRFLFEQITEDMVEDMEDQITGTIEDYLPEVEVLSVGIGPKNSISTSQRPLSIIDPYSVDLVESNTIRITIRLRNKDLQDIFSVVIGSSGEQLAISTIPETPEDSSTQSFTNDSSNSNASRVSSGGGY